MLQFYEAYLPMQYAQSKKRQKSKDLEMYNALVVIMITKYVSHKGPESRILKKILILQYVLEKLHIFEGENI